MNDYVVTDGDLLLIGTTSEKIVFRKVNSEFDGEFVFRVILFLPWLQAVVQAESIKDDLTNFLTSIKNMESLSADKCDFSSLSGNFSVEINLQSGGKIEVSGVLIPDMTKESRAEYSFESNIPCLTTFGMSLASFLETV